MRVGVPTEIKNNEYRVAITPAGVAELTRRGHDVVIQAGAGEGSSISDADFKSARAEIISGAEHVWEEADLLLKVKEPIEPEYALMRKRPNTFHLPAPGGVAALHRRADAFGRHRDRVRNGADRRRRAAPVGADERGRGPACRTGRGVSPDETRRRPRRADGRRARCGPGRRRSDRRRNCRLQRRPRRQRNGRARHRVRRQHRQAARAGRRVRRPHPHPVLVGAGPRGRAQARRPGHRRRAGPRSEGAQAGVEFTCLAHEAGRSAGGHRNRPGRLLRGLATHHPRRPHVHRARHGVLLRREHAGRGPADVDLRAHQRHDAVRSRARRPWLEGGLPSRFGTGERPLTHEGALLNEQVAHDLGLPFTDPAKVLA